MRTPIAVDGQPTAPIAGQLRAEKRATSLVYEHLVTTAGIGVAELWIEALAWGRSPAPHPGVAQGWSLYSTPASEHIARASHPRATAAVLAFSRRAWEAAQRDWETSPLLASIRGA